MTVETHTGPTPNGGDHSVAVFMDDDGRVVDKAQATKVIISEYNGDDLIFETVGLLAARVADPSSVPAQT